MQHQALYRKYRPQRFDEVIGQPHITETLTREIVEGKTAHAYLFAGPRGTGKTTTARLLAKSLNCENRGSDGEPCNACASCEGITKGSSLDVIELDAASHNKVDDVREIRVNVGTVAAAAGARRVYILDEAHMLSRAAGNALLKTLEEPPEHVVFVLATTEPYKLLDTIRSRAQRFDFHQVAADTLIDYLGTIAEREGFATDHDGLAQIASHARGSVRDAMSLLEQVAALGGGSVDRAGVGRALGLADDTAFGDLVEAVGTQDAPRALGLVARLAEQGADLRRFTGDAVAFLRGIFLAQYAPNLEEVADEAPETLETWRRYAAVIGSTDLLRTIDLFADALTQLREGREERLVVELTLLKATRPETATDAAGLAARLDRLERAQVAPTAHSPQPGAPAGRPEPPAARPPPPAPSEATADGPEPSTSGHPERTAQIDLATFSAAWPAIVARIRSDVGARRHAYVKEATPVAVEGSRVVLEVPEHLHFLLEQLRADSELQQILVDLTAEATDAAVTLEFRQGNGDESRDPDLPSRVPDKDRLAEGGEGGAGDDPTSLVSDLLGGEVVSD